MAYMARKWGPRFIEEPLYAGLPLHHQPPSYNSGHVYILNRRALQLVYSALRSSREQTAAVRKVKIAAAAIDANAKALAKAKAKVNADSDPTNDDASTVVDSELELAATLSCDWDGPVEGHFLAGCAQNCMQSASREVAQALCEVFSECGGVVDQGVQASSPYSNRRYQLRLGQEPQASATGESAFVKRRCKQGEQTNSASGVVVPAACSYDLRSPEDMQLGHCFFALGVRTWDTRDNLGREFLSFTDPKTWSPDQGFGTVMTVPWYYRGRCVVCAFVRACVFFVQYFFGLLLPMLVFLLCGCFIGFGASHFRRVSTHMRALA